MAGKARADGLDSPAPASAAGGGAGGAAPGGAGAPGVSEKFGGEAGARGGLSTPTRVTGRLRSRGQGLRKGERREACGRRGAQGAQTPRTPPGGPGLGRSRAPPACPRGGTTGARGAGQLQEEGAADARPPSVTRGGRPLGSERAWRLKASEVPAGGDPEKPSQGTEGFSCPQQAALMAPL